MEEISDEDLMALIGSGDEDAFRKLAQRHLQPSLSLARRLTRNPADAEEIVQEALLRLWRNAPRWRPTAALRTWLYRVVVNLCLSQRRRMPFAALEDAAEPVDPAPDAVARLVAAETAGLVAQAIAALPERQRAALVLTYYEGLSNAEASAVLATSVSGIESLLIRAKRTLRQTLGVTRD